MAGIDFDQVYRSKKDSDNNQPCYKYRHKNNFYKLKINLSKENIIKNYCYKLYKNYQ